MKQSERERSGAGPTARYRQRGGFCGLLCTQVIGRENKKSKTTESFATTGVRIPKPQPFFLVRKKKQQTKHLIRAPRKATEAFALSCSNAEVRLNVELVGVREETAEDETEAGDWPWPTLKETRGKTCRNQFVSQDQLSLILLQEMFF